MERYHKNKKRIDQEYLIDRLGKIHKYKGDLNVEIVSVHYEIAHDLYPDVKRPDEFLMNLGWVMIGSSVYHVPITYKILTQAQFTVLDSLDLLDSLEILVGNYFKKYSDYELH